MLLIRVYARLSSMVYLDDAIEWLILRLYKLEIFQHKPADYDCDNPGPFSHEC